MTIFVYLLVLLARIFPSDKFLEFDLMGQMSLFEIVDNYCQITTQKITIKKTELLKI